VQATGMAATLDSADAAIEKAAQTAAAATEGAAVDLRKAETEKEAEARRRNLRLRTLQPRPPKPDAHLLFQQPKPQRTSDAADREAGWNSDTDLKAPPSGDELEEFSVLSPGPGRPPADLSSRLRSNAEALRGGDGSGEKPRRIRNRKAHKRASSQDRGSSLSHQEVDSSDVSDWTARSQNSVENHGHRGTRSHAPLPPAPAPKTDKYSDALSGVAGLVPASLDPQVRRLHEEVGAAAVQHAHLKAQARGRRSVAAQAARIQEEQEEGECTTSSDDSLPEADAGPEQRSSGVWEGHRAHTARGKGTQRQSGQSREHNQPRAQVRSHGTSSDDSLPEAEQRSLLQEHWRASAAAEQPLQQEQEQHSSLASRLFQAEEQGKVSMPSLLGTHQQHGQQHEQVTEQEQELTQEREEEDEAVEKSNRWSAASNAAAAQAPATGEQHPFRQQWRQDPIRGLASPVKVPRRDLRDAEALRADFQQDGYLVLPQLWTEEEASKWRSSLLSTFAEPWTGSSRVVPAYDTACAGRDPENPLGLRFVQQVALLGPQWLALATDPRIVGLASAALGDDINLSSMKASLKPPGHSTLQGWHQDAYYLRDEPHSTPQRPRFCTVLLYLDASAEGAGATMLAPGSHTGGLVPQEELVPEGGAKAGGSILDSCARRFNFGQMEAPPMGAGDALLLSPHVIHSVGGNGAANSTKAALAFVYKDAHAVDVEEGGNWPAFAELPITRGGRAAVQLLT